MATFKIIGVYRIKPTIESIVEAVRFYDYPWLLEEDGTYCDEITWDKFENLALIEMQVIGELPDGLLDSIWLGDRSSDGQVPYLEFYLDQTGAQLIDSENAPQTENRRVCFYLHYTDTGKPLNIGPCQVDLPAMTELPQRLAPFAHYLPVN
jgi:hypothetical protein